MATSSSSVPDTKMNGRCAHRSWAILSAERPSNDGQGVIRENQVVATALERRHEIRRGVNTRHLADDPVGRERLLNELGVPGVVLEMENPERGLHVVPSPFSRCQVAAR